ncbi:MAG: PhnD/SsuA/transferrin family substrate-binding protein [Sphingobium sp.]
MIVSLPMYDLPWLHAANDRLWASLAARLRARGIADVPAALHRDDDLDTTWRDPTLLLGQTCGYPLLTRLHESVRLVATPHYDAQGCEGAFHRAAILVRQDDAARALPHLQGRTAGVNGYDSNTGMNLFRAAIAEVTQEPLFFASVVVTGSHARSFAALLSGKIDVASIDAVTWALLRDRYPEHAARLRVLAWTSASPSLPFITASRTSDAMISALRDVLKAAADDPALGDTLASLRIRSFSVQPVQAYERILQFEQQAVDRSYSELR